MNCYNTKIEWKTSFLISGWTLFSLISLQAHRKVQGAFVCFSEARDALWTLEPREKKCLYFLFESMSIYCEGLHLGSDVHDCEETVPEDGNVKLQKDVIFILFAETASKPGYCIAVICEAHQDLPEGAELSPVWCFTGLGSSEVEPIEMRALKFTFRLDSVPGNNIKSS